MVPRERTERSQLKDLLFASGSSDSNRRGMSRNYCYGSGTKREVDVEAPKPDKWSVNYLTKSELTTLAKAKAKSRQNYQRMISWTSRWSFD